MQRRTLLGLFATSAAAACTPSPPPVEPTREPTTEATPRQDLDQMFTDSAGNTSRYRLWASHLGVEPTGFVLYLHGDGHAEFDPASSDSALLDDHAAVAREHGLLLVAPITPDERTGTWWRDEASGEWLGEFIEHLQETHPIDRARTWLVGYSGGAEVITNVLLPDHSDLFTGGGAILLGGGSLDPEVVFTKEPSPQLKQDFAMTWVVGELDTPTLGGADGDFDALAEAHAAEQAYRRLGMAHTVVEILPGESHYTSADDGAPTLRRLLAEQG